MEILDGIEEYLIRHRIGNIAELIGSLVTHPDTEDEGEVG
jgi:hypothetical protein